MALLIEGLSCVFGVAGGVLSPEAQYLGEKPSVPCNAGNGTAQ